MLLTLHNLPTNMRYPDVKSLIQSKCGSMEVILDNLVQHNMYKKVTVGLADDDDAAIFVRKMNGLYVDGCQLYVEDSRQKKGVEQPYRPMHTDQDSCHVPGMVKSDNPETDYRLKDQNMPGMPYGMYNIPNQNAAMLGYNQPLRPPLTTGHFPVGQQGSSLDNSIVRQGYSANWQQTNVNSVSEGRRQDHDWNIDPAQKARWDSSSANRDHSRGKSPSRNNKGSSYDNTKSYDNRSRDSRSRYGVDPVENVSYPQHLYSRQDLFPNRVADSRPDNMSGYDNASGDSYLRQNDRSRDQMDKRPVPARARQSFGDDPPLGFDTASERRSRFDNNPPASSRFDHEPQRRPGFNREPNQLSGFYQKTLRGRPGFGQDRSGDRDRSDQEQNFKRAAKRRPGFDEEERNVRPRFNHESQELHPSFGQGSQQLRPGFDKSLRKRVRSRKQTRTYQLRSAGVPIDTPYEQPEMGKNRYFEKNVVSSSGGPNSTKNWNRPPMQDSNNLIRPLKKSRPNFGEEFIPIGGGPKRPGDFAPRQQGPRGPNPAQKVSKYQSRNQGINNPRPNLNITKPPKPTTQQTTSVDASNTSEEEVSAALKQALHVHDNSLFQGAGVVAREMIRNLQLEKKEARAVLKGLKKSIRARFLEILGEALCESPQTIVKMYREKYPVSQDHEFFETVLRKIENGDFRKSKPSEGDESASTANEASTSETLADDTLKKQAKVQNVAADPNAPVPKYPNADKNMMKQQKKLVKEEYLNEDIYELPELTKKALEQELDKICDVFRRECKNGETDVDNVVLERVSRISVPDFRKSLKLNATRRILNVATGLNVRIFFYGKQPHLSAMNEFLKDYGVLSCRKAVKAPNFIASLDSYDNYDRLLAVGNAVVDDTSIAIKPLQITGYKPRPNVNPRKSKALGNKNQINDTADKQNTSNDETVANENTSIDETEVKQNTSNDEVEAKVEVSKDIDVKQETPDNEIDKQETPDNEIDKQETPDNEIKQETPDANIKLIENFEEADLDLAEEDLEDY